MIVRDAQFEVREKFRNLSAKEKREYGISADDCVTTDAEFLDAQELCYYCSEPLSIPCCMWHGEGGRQIYLHRECVYRFANRLMRDADELQIGKADADELLSQREARGGEAS